MEQVLSGQASPGSAAERIEFAGLLYAKARYEEAARMYLEAFTVDAALADDLVASHRYAAACSAARAAARDSEAAGWRGRALEWLRTDLAARRKAATDLARDLGRWKGDADLVGVRDRIDDLPEAEREAWRNLWAEVDEALGTAAR
jgi:Arc/MetJ-type ribon-helix-helix transcriptional regulator